MALVWTFDTQAFGVAPGVACVIGRLTVDSYVQYVDAPLAGEGIMPLLHKFRNQKLLNVHFHGDGTHEFTIMWDDSKLKLTVQASGSQPSAGADTTTRFTAWGAA